MIFARGENYCMIRKLGVVILNYKNYLETESCLESLMTQKGVDLDVVVVDNGSENESAEMLSEWIEPFNNIELIVSPNNLGYAQGNNLGIKRLVEKKVEFIILSNSDIAFSNENILATIVKEYRQGIGVITPIIRNLDGKIEMRTQYRSNLFYLRVFKHLINIQRECKRKRNQEYKAKDNGYISLSPGVQDKYYTLTGCFFALTPDFIRNFPFIFPETFLYGEEIATLVLNRKLKLKTAIVDTSDVIHKRAASTDVSLSEGSVGKKRLMAESARKIMKILFMTKHQIRKKYVK